MIRLSKKIKAFYKKHLIKNKLNLFQFQPLINILDAKSCKRVETALPVVLKCDDQITVTEVGL